MKTQEVKKMNTDDLITQYLNAGSSKNYSLAIQLNQEVYKRCFNDIKERGELEMESSQRVLRLLTNGLLSLISQGLKEKKITW
jgi:hypothetical protein